MELQVLLLAAAAARAAAPPPTAVVDGICGLWSNPPDNCPAKQNMVSDGAFTGNGDLAVIIGAAPVAPTTLAFYHDLTQFRCPHDGHDCPDGAHVGVGWMATRVWTSWTLRRWSAPAQTSRCSRCSGRRR